MTWRVDLDVPVRARDGAVLATDVYRPARRGPVVLVRAPYGKQHAVPLPDILRFLQAGYAVVLQDARGRGASSGCFEPFEFERRDGADAIAWIAAQPWSDGRVAMTGASYFGATQLLAARAAPDALLAIAPTTTSLDLYDGWAYEGGALRWGFNLTWALLHIAPETARRRVAAGELVTSRLDDLRSALDGIDGLLRDPGTLDRNLVRELAPHLDDWLDHPTRDDYWDALMADPEPSAAAVPTLHVGGWYDCFLRGTLASYRSRRTAEEHPTPHRLIVGPWSHGLSTGVFPERSFGVRASAASADVVGEQIRFFDDQLAHRPADPARSPVRIFVMGIDEWRDAADWPLPEMRTTPLYLASDGAANSRHGHGRLLAEPAPAVRADSFVYDPCDPVPTVGGQTFLPGSLSGWNVGPVDRREVESRQDVLCYTTPPLEHDVEVIGEIALVLHVSSSAPDTDFTGTLVDVHPDGRAVILTDGILRARYRNSLRQPEPLTDGAVHELRVDLGATANVFRAGHRIRLEVSSSNFPRFDRNSNTGGTIADEGPSDFRTATNTVIHGVRRPSRLELPISRHVRAVL